MQPTPPDAHPVSVTIWIPTAASPGETVMVHVAIAAFVEASALRTEMALSATTAASLIKSLGNTILCFAPAGNSSLRSRQEKAE